MAGLVSKKIVSPNQLWATDKRPQIRKKIKARYGINLTKDNCKLTESVNVVLLAVKPQDMREVVEEIKTGIDLDKLLISIAAGLETRQLEGWLNKKVPVIRVMPNTPCLIGEGISAIAKGRFAKGGDLVKVKKIFQALGEIVVIEEKFMDLVTLLSGCGPGYFSFILDILISYTERWGLKREIAERLLIKTLEGTGSLLDRMKLSPKDLVNKVSSRGGVTEAVLEVFKQNNLDSLLETALRKGLSRAKELSRGR